MTRPFYHLPFLIAQVTPAEHEALTIPCMNIPLVRRQHVAEYNLAPEDKDTIFAIEAVFATKVYEFSGD